MASCHNYHFDQILGLGAARNASVFAGCFYWDSALEQLGVMHHWGLVLPWSASARYASPRAAASGRAASRGVSCVVLVREPISRTVSCFNEYFRDKGLFRENGLETTGREHALRASLTSGRPLQSLGLAQAADVLTNLTDTHQGCVNEIARWLSPSVGWGDRAINAGDVSGGAIEETKRRMAQCVVGDMTSRTEDTLRVFRRWFPWLRVSGANIGHHSAHGDPPLSEEMRGLLTTLNVVDVELYAFAMARFEMQLAALERTV